MKQHKLILCAIAVLAATAMFAAPALASRSALACGPWQICFCKSLGCSTGGQLCMSGGGIDCYQAELSRK